MSTDQTHSRKRPLTDTVAILVCGNGLIEKTIKRSETDRSDILVTLLQLSDDPRDRTSRFGEDTDPWLTDVTSRWRTFLTRPTCQFSIKVDGRSNEVDMGLDVLGEVIYLTTLLSSYQVIRS